MTANTRAIKLQQSDEGWPIVLVLIWLSLLGAFVTNIQPVFIGALSEAFLFNAQQLGFIAGIELGGAALASICAVFWFGKINLRKLCFAALLVLVLGNLLTTWIASYPLLLTVRFLCGFLGSGVIYAMTVGLIGQLPNTERNVAIMVISQVLFLSISMVILPMLLNAWQLKGMTFVMTILYATGLIFIPFIPKFGVERKDVAHNNHCNKNAHILSRGLLVSIIVFFIGLGCLWVFLERIGDINGFSLTDIGNALAIGGLIGGIGAAIPAIFGKRFGRLLPLSLGLIGQIFVCFLLLTRHDWMSYLIAISLFNLFWNLVLPYLFGAIAKVDNSGRYMVLIPAAQSAGMAIGPMLVSMFIVGDSYYTAAWISMVVFTLCLMITVPLFRRMP